MTNVWTSPSPHADSLDPEPVSVVWVGWHIVTTLFRRLWNAYIDHLVYYQPSSWIGHVASTFRILAVMLVLPVVLLTLLDVTSYVIARTLGVIDDVKASTIDPAVDPPASTTGVSSASDGHVAVTGVSSHGLAERPSEDRASEEVASERPAQTCYFAGEDDLRLAGEGVFSPAASVPSSPVTPRVFLQTLVENESERIGQVGEEGVMLRRRAAQNIEAGMERT